MPERKDWDTWTPLLEHLPSTVTFLKGSQWSGLRRALIRIHCVPMQHICSRNIHLAVGKQHQTFKPLCFHSPRHRHSTGSSFGSLTSLWRKNSTPAKWWIIQISNPTSSSTVANQDTVLYFFSCVKRIRTSIFCSTSYQLTPTVTQEFYAERLFNRSSPLLCIQVWPDFAKNYCEMM